MLSHPTQYYSPWFRWLAAHTPLPFRVFYLWDFGVTPRRDAHFGTTFQWDVDLLSGYESEIVPNRARSPGTESFAGLDNPTLTTRLEKWRPQTIVLFGYKYASHLRVIAWARRRRIPLVFRGDSHALGRQPPTGVAGWLLRTLYRQFAAVTWVGSANRDYFRSLGVPDKRLFFAPHAVDASRFDASAADVREAAAQLRTNLGLPVGTQVVLFAGKLVADKQPLELLRAFVELARPDAALVFVGDGSEKPALLAAARQAAPGTVHVLPFANQSEMPARYALADVFVLPSRGCYETWGLAVNEAMHMGRPCVVSDRVGCQRDLVIDGVTGWVFAHDNPEQLRCKLGQALDATRDDAEAWTHRVKQRIAGYSYAAAAEGLLRALGSVPTTTTP